MCLKSFARECSPLFVSVLTAWSAWLTESLTLMKKILKMSLAVQRIRDVIVNGDDGEDGEGYGFSWTPCEMCGSHLGGDRYQAVVFNDKI